MKPSSGLILRRAATFAAALLIVLLLPGSSSAQEAFDLTGEWILTVESPNGTGTREATFVQVGDELKGTITSSMASGELTGKVEGDRVTFTAVVMMDSGAFEVVYEARFEGGQLREGSVSFGDYGAGTFTGVRKTPG